MCIRCISKNEEDDGDASSSFLFQQIEAAIKSQEVYYRQSNEILQEVRNTVLSMPDDPSIEWIHDLLMLTSRASGKRRFADACQEYVDRRIDGLVNKEEQ